VTNSPAAALARQLRVPKAAELIAAHLRRQIVRGELSEGDGLASEASLMQQFDVSRPTLREAYRILESEGLITVRRGAHGGARVHLPRAGVAARYAALVLQADGAQLSDVYEARTIIEGPVAGILAARRSDEDVAILRDLNDQVADCEGDLVAVLAIHHRFHNALIERVGNKTLALLALIIDEILDAADFRHVEALIGDESEQRSSKRAQRTHVRLVELIEVGAVAESEALWRKHLSEAAQHVISASGASDTLDVTGLTGPRL
jgi:DNA-binding FadR family transcriptional regulator